MKWISYKINPTKPARYLVTAITRHERYITLLDFDGNGWHDVNHKSSLSHVVLAWTEIELCNDDYNFDNIIFVGN